MKTVTTAQLKKMHALLNGIGLMHRKRVIIHSFTGGRTQSARDMYMDEAKEMIDWLEDADVRKSYIKQVWHLAYYSGIIEENRHEQSINAAKLDLFCKQHGTIKKPLGEQNKAELKRTVRQFEAIAEKCRKKYQAALSLEQFNKELAHCIETEDYETAGMIKQKIDELKKQLSPKRRKAPKTA